MEFQIGQNDRGQDVAINVHKLEDGSGFYKPDEDSDSQDDLEEGDYEEEATDYIEEETVDYIEEEETEEVFE